MFILKDENKRKRVREAHFVKKTDRTKMTNNFWHQVGEEYIKRIAPLFKQLFEQSNGYPSGLKTGTVQLQVFCPSRLPKTQT